MDLEIIRFYLAAARGSLSLINEQLAAEQPNLEQIGVIADEAIRNLQSIQVEVTWQDHNLAVSDGK